MGANWVLNLTFGSKHVTRSQMDYFGKGLQVFSPKITFTCK
jgi:hypothetical protein